MRYAEYAPSERLTPFIRCLWTLVGHAADFDAPVQPILPDGCPELVMHFGDAFERVYRDGRVERQATVLFAGQLTEHLTLQPTGRIAVLGVRFHPHGAAALLDVPQHDLVGLTIDVDAVSPPLFRVLRAACDSSRNPSTAVASVEQRLIERLDPSRCDPRLAYAVDAISRRRGMVSIDRLAQRVGWTRRHLERRFQHVVGISPKRLARITRFQAAVCALERSDAAQSGALTAAAIGYADQAHFVREFRELAGCAPGAHLLRNAEMNGYFNRQDSSKNPDKTTSPCGLSTE